MERQRMAEDGWRRLLVVVWALVGLLLILAAVGWLISRVSGALTPFVLAFILVLVLRGPVNRLQAAGMPRGLAVLVCYLISIVAIVAIGLLLFPPLVAQISQLGQEAPKYYKTVSAFVISLLGRYRAMHVPSWLESFANDATQRAGTLIVGWSTALTSILIAGGKGLIGFLVDSVLALVVSFFLLRDLPIMREEFLSIFGSERRDEARTIYVKVITVLGGFLRGQLIIATIVGVLSTIALALLGVPFPLLIGTITGVFNVVPYFGPIVGGVLATLAAALGAAQGASPWLILFAPLSVFAVQQIDSTFLSPRIMSEQVDLHPVLVIFSLLVGGSLFGFVGLLLAIPFAAVAKGLFVYYYEKHTRESLGTESGALFRQGKKGRPGNRGADTETPDEKTGRPGTGAGKERD